MGGPRDLFIFGETMREFGYQLHRQADHLARQDHDTSATEKALRMVADALEAALTEISRQYDE